jgi:hypothetical protein
LKCDHDAPSSVQSVEVACTQQMQASAPLSPRLLSSSLTRPPPLCTQKMQTSAPLSPRLLSPRRATPLSPRSVTSIPPMSPSAVHLRAHQKVQGISREKFLQARSVFLGSPRSPRSPLTPMSPSPVAMRETSGPATPRYPSLAARLFSGSH